MSVKIADIYDKLNEIAPFSTQEAWDNSGLLVGDVNAEVSHVLVTLDINQGAVDMAEKLGAELIISHHPIIFEPMKRLATGSVVYRLAEKNIAALCAHTNLDLAADGVNKSLANALMLKNLRGFVPCSQSNLALGIIGTLPNPMTAAELAYHVKAALGVPVRMADGCNNINEIAICGGAGGDLVFAAISEGVQAIVTSEIKHHQFIAAFDSELTAIDATHYATEAVVLQPVVDMLKKSFNIEVTLCSSADVLKFI